MKRSSDPTFPKYHTKTKHILIQDSLNRSIDSSNYNINNLKCDYFPTIKSTKAADNHEENPLIKMSDYFEKGPSAGSMLPQFCNNSLRSSREPNMSMQNKENSLTKSIKKCKPVFEDQNNEIEQYSGQIVKMRNILKQKFGDAKIRDHSFKLK